MENLTVCWPIDQGSIKWWIIYLHLGAVFVYVVVVVHSSFRHFHLLSIGATAIEGCIPSTTILMIVRTHLREKQVYTSIKRLVYIQTNSTYEEVVREGGYLRVGLVIRHTVCDPKKAMSSSPYPIAPRGSSSSPFPPSCCIYMRFRELWNTLCFLSRAILLIYSST